MKHEQKQRRGRSGAVVMVSLAALVVAATGVACGSVAGDSGSTDTDSGTSGTGTDAAANPVVTPTPTSTASATGSASAAPVSTSDSGGADASSSPLIACPTAYASLITFLNTTSCGGCAGSQCAALAASCFSDCACINGALAVFGCSVISSDITDCIGLASEIPPQYQTDTYVCAMTCEDVCSSAGDPTDSGPPLTDSGAASDAADAHD